MIKFQKHCAKSRIAGTRGVEPRTLHHSAKCGISCHAPKNLPCISPCTAKFFVTLSHLKRTPQQAIQMSAFSAYRVSAYSRITRVVALRCFTPISARRFSGTSRIFPNPAANCKVRHLGVTTELGIGYSIGIYIYQRPLCGQFLPLSCILFRAHKGAIMALFLHVLFPYNSRTPKFACFAYAD